MAEYRMMLVSRREIAKDTMAFWFDTNGAQYEFRAGQHADFAFSAPHNSSDDTSRTFSLASVPEEKKSIIIAMRMRETGFKSALKTAPSAHCSR
jgi:ferredoxin-NADP reductase